MPMVGPAWYESACIGEDNGYVSALSLPLWTLEESVFNFTDLLLSCWAQELIDLWKDINT